ncbi:MAG: preprotein translocase subunit SecG [Clostridia bacterium]|nr:preprotein translocase subunit SecG [Clostridia bacterium]
MAMYILGSAILVLAVAIIVCVSVQQGKSQGLGAMAGGSDAADSYYSKNKGRDRDAVLSKITIVLSILIVICVVAMNIISA